MSCTGNRLPPSSATGQIASNNKLVELMSLESDLKRIITQHLDESGVNYGIGMDDCELTARYLEMLNRRIAPLARKVHLSREIHTSLGILRRKADVERQEAAGEAWATVFFLHHLLVHGQNVNGFLSTKICNLSARDGLLWDYGMHHFHLSRAPHDKDRFGAIGFVKRSDYLLFSVITHTDAYFVDVRPHPHPQRRRLGWVEQDLIKIVNSNWPEELIRPNIINGVRGTTLTDEEIYELRRKRIYSATEIGGNAIAPLGGGMTTRGSSVLCMLRAQSVLDEIRRYQHYLDTQPMELRAALEARGMTNTGEMSFALVLLDSVNATDEVIDVLADSRLGQLGMAVVERTTHLPIVVSWQEAGV